MTKTLAQLRAESADQPAPLPTATKTVTLVKGQHLFTESQALDLELLDLLAAEPGQVNESGNKTSAPRKAGEGPNPRIAEIRDAQIAMLPRLAEFQGEVGLRGMEGGDWWRWKEAHPADPDSAIDDELTGGLCSAKAVFDELGRFVVSWNGEALGPGEWDSWTAKTIIFADRRDLVTAVVQMQEDGVDRAPKSLSGSSVTESSATN